MASKAETVNGVRYSNDGHVRNHTTARLREFRADAEKRGEHVDGLMIARIDAELVARGEVVQSAACLVGAHGTCFYPDKCACECHAVTTATATVPVEQPEVRGVFRQVAVSQAVCAEFEGHTKPDAVCLNCGHFYQTHSEGTLRDLIEQEAALEFMQQGFTRAQHVECYKERHRDEAGKAWDTATARLSKTITVLKALNTVRREIQAFA